MAKLYSNNFSTTITTATVGTGDTFIDLTSATGLPLIGSGEYVHLTLTDSLTAPTKTEIVKAIALSTLQIEVVRAQENTTAQIWNSGDFIELRATADSFERLDGTEITQYKESVNLAATATIDRNDGGIQVLTLTQAETLAFSNFVSGQNILLHIINGSTHAVTWPTITWIGGSAPSLTSNYVLSFWNVDGTIFGAQVGSY